MKPVQHIINISGGKDSEAVYLRAIERGVPFRAVSADTGNEHTLTYEQIATLHLKTGGPQVEIVKADFSADMERKRRFISEKWPDSLSTGSEGKWVYSSVKRIPHALAPPMPDFSGQKYGGAPIKVGPWKWRAGRAPMPKADAQAFADEAVKLLRPTGNPYVDLCMLKGRFPSRMSQFCTEELKTLPIVEQIILGII